MPRAEVGSTKFLNNKLKSKGLQRLRWYCQVCERQMRDENGFKCHTQSESHVRQMLLVGEDPRKAINDFSNQFQRDFLQLLRTSHGEKKVNINHFYQEYIANKEHVHMNATRWPSLTEYAKHLGREGICRVEETDKGLMVAWIDNSPEALRRQDAIRKKERQDKGDEEREQRLIREQVARANQDAKDVDDDDGDAVARPLQRTEGDKIKLSFGVKQTEPKPSASTSVEGELDASPADADEAESTSPVSEPPAAPEKVSMKMGGSTAKNVFAMASKKNALGAKKSAPVAQQPQRPMSQAERIMKEEIERKRAREGNAMNATGLKRQRVS